MQIIPVQNVPSQTLQVNLAGQSTQLNIYTLDSGLYMDVLVNGAVIISGVICQNWNRIVRNSYLGFVGDLAWNDNQGTRDPVYPGLGARFTLWYLPVADLSTMGVTE